MNCMSKKAQQMRYKLADERRIAARNAFLNSLTEEERTQFLENEKSENEERRKRAAEFFASWANMYSFMNNAGIRRYY